MLELVWSQNSAFMIFKPHFLECYDIGVCLPAELQHGYDNYLLNLFIESWPGGSYNQVFNCGSPRPKEVFKVFKPKLVERIRLP